MKVQQILSKADLGLSSRCVLQFTTLCNPLHPVHKAIDCYFYGDDDLADMLQRDVLGDGVLAVFRSLCTCTFTDVGALRR